MDIDARRAQRLFQAVVAQALLDATAPDARYSTKPLLPVARKRTKATKKNRARFAETKKQYEDRLAQRNKDALELRRLRANAPRTQARAWLLSDIESFAQIVSLAGYNPVDIRERARKLADEGWPARVKASADLI